MKTTQKKGYRGLRQKQLFKGELTDGDLFLLEDVLVWAAENKRITQQAADDLINKFYAEFTEKRENGKICYAKKELK